MRRRDQKPRPGIIPEIVRLWMFRVLVDLGAHRDFVQKGGLNDDGLAEATRLTHWRSDQTDRYEQARALADLRKNAAAAKAAHRKPAIPRTLTANGKRLARLVGLSTAERQILEFAVLVHSCRVLRDALDLLGDMSLGTLKHALSVLLDQPEAEIAGALASGGLLGRSGLLSIDHKSTRDISSKLDLLSDSFAELMLHADTDPVTLLRGLVAAAPPPVMQLSDYDNIRPALVLLMPYVRSALRARRPGVNVLIYGVPGTGKTQLARVLAKELEADLFEVASEDADGDIVDRHTRLRAYRAAQCLLGRSKALVVFDEIEDVFPVEISFSGHRTPARNKGWINRALEANPAPAIWLSNSVDCLDPAVIRRFDQVIELPIPPTRQRARLIRQSCEGLLDDSQISQLSKIENLAPAIVMRAASVVGTVRSELASRTGAAVVELVSNTLRAQGHVVPPMTGQANQGAGFELEFIRTAADLNAIVRGLARSRTGRICFYGPPGTGKTACARHIADELGMAIHTRKASDLLSPWVGRSERNVAKAFQDAAREGCMLVIDEADTFLADRRGARNNWEVSLTNELLTQLESFDGIFVATTNLVDDLDPASLRRFDLKAHFEYLAPDQLWKLLGRQLTGLGLAAPDPALRRRLEGLDNLTPGDVAVLVRRHRFEPMQRSESWLSALEAEAALKRGGKNRIGF